MTIRRRTLVGFLVAAHLFVAGAAHADDVPPPPAATANDPASTPTTEPARDEGVARWVVPGALSVVGLAGIGFGIGFGISSQNLTDDYRSIRRSNPGLCGDATNPKCLEYDAKRSDADSASDLSIGSYVVGGVFLAAAVVTFLVWPSSMSHARAPSKDNRTATSTLTVRPLPLVGFGQAGGALVGSF